MGQKDKGNEKEEWGKVNWKWSHDVRRALGEGARLGGRHWELCWVRGFSCRERKKHSVRVFGRNDISFFHFGGY